MGTINGKFSDQDSYVLTAQIQVSNNNATALNATIAETDQIRGSAVIFQPMGLLDSPANPVPNVTTAAQGDIGAALGGVGQEGTPALEPGGGGNPCFIGVTRIATPTGDVHIGDLELGTKVWGFDGDGERVPQRVIAKQAHIVQSYLLVEFADGRVTGVTPNHKYWTKDGYAPISELDFVWHWSHNAWIKCLIARMRHIDAEIIVYNLSVEGTRNYLANGDAVSNLKPLNEQ